MLRLVFVLSLLASPALATDAVTQTTPATSAPIVPDKMPPLDAAKEATLRGPVPVTYRHKPPTAAGGLH